MFYWAIFTPLLKVSVNVITRKPIVSLKILTEACPAGVGGLNKLYLAGADPEIFRRGGGVEAENF